MSLSEFSALFEHSIAKGSRSTVLNTIAWLIVSLSTFIIISFKYDFDLWIKIILVIFFSISIIIFLFSFLFCLFYHQDALRSEKFVITKLAIEKHLAGDSSSSQLIEKKSKFLLNDKDLEIQTKEIKM